MTARPTPKKINQPSAVTTTKSGVKVANTPPVLDYAVPDPVEPVIEIKDMRLPHEPMAAAPERAAPEPAHVTLLAVVDPYQAMAMRHFMDEDAIRVTAYGERMDGERFLNLIVPRYHTDYAKTLTRETYVRWVEKLKLVCSGKVIIL